MEKGAGAEKMTTTEERSGEKRKEESWRGLNVRNQGSVFSQHIFHTVRRSPLKIIMTQQNHNGCEKV
jgi:hypothetical protein